MPPSRVLATIRIASPIFAVSTRKGIHRKMTSSTRKSRLTVARWLALAVAVFALASAAGTAKASLGLSTLLSPCSGQLTQPFLRWGDPSYYAFGANGGFENGVTGWSLTGQAQQGFGNESFSVHSTSDEYALSLPAGSSATSPSTCLGTLSPTLRFFARSSGDPGSTLRVDVLYRDALGLRWAVPVATLSGSSAWAPTPPELILANVTALPLLTGGAAQVQFRLTPQGTGGAWQVDDVYVDPYKGS
jgi:hypothetical protein